MKNELDNVKAGDFAYYKGGIITGPFYGFVIEINGKLGVISNVEHQDLYEGMDEIWEFRRLNRPTFFNYRSEWWKKSFHEGELVYPIPTVTELTMDEIAEKFGIDVKTLKIKK
jgi:hypothetical protein